MKLEEWGYTTATWVQSVIVYALERLATLQSFWGFFLPFLNKVTYHCKIYCQQKNKIKNVFSDHYWKVLKVVFQLDFMDAALSCGNFWESILWGVPKIFSMHGKDWNVLRLLSSNSARMPTETYKSTTQHTTGDISHQRQCLFARSTQRIKGPFATFT